MIISQSPEKTNSVWTKALEEHTGYKSVDLKNCSEAYCTLTQLILSSDKHGIMDKFAKSEYLEVLRIIKQVFNKEEKKNGIKKPADSIVQ